MKEQRKRFLYCCRGCSASCWQEMVPNYIFVLNVLKLGTQSWRTFARSSSCLKSQFECA